MGKDKVISIEDYLLRTVPGADAGERARQLAANQAKDREEQAARRKEIQERQKLLREISAKRLMEGDTGEKVDRKRDFLLLGLRADIQELRRPSDRPFEGRLLEFPKKST